MSALAELEEFESQGAEIQQSLDEAPKLQIKLSKPQSRVFNSPARFRINVAGRRSGKTYLAKVLLVAAALKDKNQRVWYVAPTYRMAKQIIWSEIKELVLSMGYAASKPNESDLSIPLLNGSMISLRGADNGDSLRGVGIDFLVMDEAQDMNEETWFAVLLPALADRGGRAVFCGTPKGFNWFYDLYSFGLSEDDWAVFRSTTLEGGQVPPEEIERSRTFMDERLFKQEFEASFETLAGRVYSRFERDDNVDDDVGDYGGEIYVGMDFNVNPMSAVIACRAGDELHVFDEIELMDANTELMALALLERFPNRHITVCPDPAGRARKTSAAVGRTDFTILEEAGLKVSSPRAAPPVVDRINEVNSMLCNAEDRIRLLVHPRCTSLIKSLEGMVYRDGVSVPDKRGGLDHMADALGYLVHDQFPINNTLLGSVKLRGFY